MIRIHPPFRPPRVARRAHCCCRAVMIIHPAVSIAFAIFLSLQEMSEDLTRRILMHLRRSQHRCFSFRPDRKHGPLGSPNPFPFNLALFVDPLGSWSLIAPDADCAESISQYRLICSSLFKRRELEERPDGASRLAVYLERDLRSLRSRKDRPSLSLSLSRWTTARNGIVDRWPIGSRGAKLSIMRHLSTAAARSVPNETRRGPKRPAEERALAPSPSPPLPSPAIP